MQVTAKVLINAAKHEVWRVITDIENAASRISGLQDVEILDRPAEGIVGLKWKETRTLFGKTATETMWITDSVENDYYDTEARSHGSIYRSKIRLSEQNGGTGLVMEFGAEAESLVAKILSATMGFMFKGATQKALQQDLEDVKAAVESG